MFVQTKLLSMVRPEFKQLVSEFKRRNIVFNYGCDFTGIGAPIQALKILGIPFIHQFSCDNDPHVKESIKCNYRPNFFYDDILNRNHIKLPNIDIYVAGPPCVAFSSAGNRHGLSDPRGILYIESLNVICIKQPQIFIVENVMGLLTNNNGQTINFIDQYIKKNLSQYHIHVIIMNTKDYGIPQNRQRLFLVGIHHNLSDALIDAPQPIRKLFDLDDIKETIIDESELKNLKHITTNESKLLVDLAFNFPDLWEKNYVVDLSQRRNQSIMLDRSPCLKKAYSKYYVTKWKRKMTIREVLSLQGFPETFKVCVTNNQMYQQIGNSMSVNVLILLFQEIFLKLWGQSPPV